MIRPAAAFLVALTVLLGGCALAPADPSSAPGPRASAGPTSPMATASTPPTSQQSATRSPLTPQPSATARPSSPAPAPIDCRRAKCVALTFDDGPGPETGKLLDILVAAKVPATFFLVGRMVRRDPTTTRRIAKTPGMTIANHTMTHAMLTRLGPAAVRREIEETTTLLRRTTGVSPRYFRPPYGLHNATVDAVARRQGQAVVLWSAGSLDWVHQTPAKVVAATLPQIRDGAIVLAHDTHSWTVRAVPSLIRKLRAAGYTLVSLDDILGPTKPGAVYSRGR